MLLAIDWDTVFVTVLLILIVLGIIFVPRGVSSKSKDIYYVIKDERMRNRILGKKKGK